MGYINNLALTDEAIAKALKDDRKSPEKMWDYITAQARQQAINNCACVDEDTVYQWARHYWLEEVKEVKIDYPDEETETEWEEYAKKEQAKQEAKHPRKRSSNETVEQLNLFEFGND